MISLVDSTQSAAVSLATPQGAAGPQVAARPANISSPVPPSGTSAPSGAESGDVTISARALRQLQREQDLAAMNTARTENTGSQAFAARMAYELAYGEEQVFRTSTIAANSLTVKGAPASAAYVISDAESRQEHARFARIALYELEKARGTPPDKIYDKLQALSVIQPAFQ